MPDENATPMSDNERERERTGKERDKEMGFVHLFNFIIFAHVCGVHVTKLMCMGIHVCEVNTHMCTYKCKDPRLTWLSSLICGCPLYLLKQGS